MEEKIYLGAQWGTFVDDKGQKRRFCSVFVMEPFPQTDNPDYYTSGYRAVKYRLTDPRLVNGLNPLDPVEVYFSSKGAVTKLVKVEGSSVEGYMASAEGVA